MKLSARNIIIGIIVLLLIVWGVVAVVRPAPAVDTTITEEATTTVTSTVVTPDVDVATDTPAI